MINRVHLSHLPWIKIRWSQISAIYNDYKFKFVLRNFKRPCYRKWRLIVYIGYVDYVMAKRENLSKLNLNLLKTLTLKEELVKEI